jgi:hypothetical protein
VKIPPTVTDHDCTSTIKIAIFATAPLATCCTSAEIDREERKGEKPSDHAPVAAELNEELGT